jgi:SAM-dependent methyltransferase
MSGAVEVFDLHAEDYDNWFDTPEGKVLFEMEVDAVRLLMKDLKKPFLEVGVGTGRFAKELGIEFGIDPSGRALEIAERRGIKVKEAKGESLPFKDGSFGAVFLLFTICFVGDPKKVFSEIKRVLKKGGGLIIGIINRESLWGELYMKKKSEGHPIYKHAKFYGVDEVIEMVEKEGMAIGGYSSTLRQPPTETPYEVHDGLIKDAGFVCLLAKN